MLILSNEQIEGLLSMEQAIGPATISFRASFCPMQHDRQRELPKLGSCSALMVHASRMSPHKFLGG
jgi:hypothetical protein